MRVDDLMTRNVVCCRHRDSLKRAGELMWNRDVGSLPVLDDDERPVAMITDRDIAMAAAMHDQPLGQLEVALAMSRDLVWVGPKDSAEAAEEKMRTRQVHRLPVVEDGRVVGVVSLNDIARAVASGSPRGDARDVIQTLGAITHPRSAPLVPTT